MAGRLENGALQVEVSSVDLNPILRDSLSAVKAIAKKKNIQLVFSPPAGRCFVLGNVGALQQVFINLLGNAVKFSPDNSEVKLQVERQDTGTRISVTDSGLGIPSDAMPYLFERFYRARNVSMAEIPGSGIGLFIVKSILKEVDGAISVDSKVNEGTTFTVVLKNR
jgi:signal transduction histidine kinase